MPRRSMICRRAPPHLQDDKRPRTLHLKDVKVCSQQSHEEWLYRRAKGYQEDMSEIPIPTDRKILIPCKSWTELGRSMKHIYDQPFHYLTNTHLEEMDIERGDTDISLDVAIDPVIAQRTVWKIEELNRMLTTPRHLFKLWIEDPIYDNYIDPVLPNM